IHLRTAEVDWILRISEDLNEAGIRHWVTPSKLKRALNLFVLPSDQEKAALIDQTRYAIEISEAAEGAGWPQRPDRSRRQDPSPDNLDIKLCPSCGGEYQLWAETCADCGVPLVRPWDLDSARESAAPRVAMVDSSDPGTCPACGEGRLEGALECPGCGLMLAQPEGCPNCGAELEAFVASCERCGHKLVGVVEGGSSY
ncbi:MAG TPA: hypothetical protein VE078_11860, partial [Thermoanaerobaculia bacterium]|nr:hypothetical protein [Thermoanaerobaculia bacterium]